MPIIKKQNIRRYITGLLAIIVSAIGLFSGVGQALAQGEPVITGSTVQGNFPASIAFTLEASASANITDIRLHYRVERSAYARVVSEIEPSFSPASHVEASWTWDMRQSGGLPPGTEVEYWWTVKDANGRSAKSPSQTFSFEDKRFQWRQVVQGNLVFRWYSGSETSTRALLATSFEGLAGLEVRTGAYLSQPVNVYVYANTQDMLGAMIFPQEWTGAATYADYGTIIIGLSANQDWNVNTMVHELAHVVSYQMTRSPYANLPNWLNEGFSMYAEGGLDVYFTSELNSALNDGRTITARSLSSPFSADPALSYLAYAESYSFLDYLVSTYGQAKLMSLLEVFRRGATYDEALNEVYGFDMDGLYGSWLPYALQRYVGVGAA